MKIFRSTAFYWKCKMVFCHWLLHLFALISHLYGTVVFLFQQKAWNCFRLKRSTIRGGPFDIEKKRVIHISLLHFFVVVDRWPMTDCFCCCCWNNSLPNYSLPTIYLLSTIYLPTMKGMRVLSIPTYLGVQDFDWNVQHILKLFLFWYDVVDRAVVVVV